MDTAVLAVVNVSPPRRWFGIGVLIAMGALLLWMTLLRASSAPPGWQAFLLATGLGTLWLALRMYRATAERIELTEGGLHSSDGREIAAMAEILSVDRGALAFKPSNGFLLRTRSRHPLAWEPGLWWRIGRRVGVGGVTAAAQTKAMADILGARLAEARR